MVTLGHAFVQNLPLAAMSVLQTMGRSATSAWSASGTSWAGSIVLTWRELIEKVVRVK
jgi:hypothetical protein